VLNPPQQIGGLEVPSLEKAWYPVVLGSPRLTLLALQTMLEHTQATWGVTPNHPSQATLV